MKESRTVMQGRDGFENWVQRGFRSTYPVDRMCKANAFERQLSHRDFAPIYKIAPSRSCSIHADSQQTFAQTSSFAPEVR